MINDLIYFDNSIVGRYRTVERNIKAKSNSFYDSFLDLLENTIKRILNLEEVEYDEKYTCGSLLREELIVRFFKEDVKINDYTYTKCKDYIAKVNKHKHFNEHMINIDTVITYMKVYHNLVSSYLHFKEKECSPFNADHFNSIYGLTEKENKELKNEVERLKDDLDSLFLENKLSAEDNAIYKSLVSIKEMENLSLEDQNTELRNQLSKLKDIKINTIELKLNKALELLYNLTDSVVESRAIGIAVGKSITGKDITQTDYMKDAVEIVSTKESVFSKLEQQGKEISDLSSKFSDMDVEALYKTAKAHFEAHNYEIAKQYYEHICLLKPLDWKAPFYLGICKSKGNYTVYEWVYKVFPFTANVYFTAINQIKAISDSEEKELAIKEVYESGLLYAERSIDNFVKHIKEPGAKNKFKIYKDEMSLIFGIQNFVIKLIKELKYFAEIRSLVGTDHELAKLLVEAIKQTNGCCDGENVSEQEYNEYMALLEEKDKIPYKPKKK